MRPGLADSWGEWVREYGPWLAIGFASWTALGWLVWVLWRAFS